MNTKQVYWLVLVSVLGAWFTHSPVDKVFSTRVQPKVHIDVTPVLKKPANLGITQDQWPIGGKCNIERINGNLMTSSESNITRDTPLMLTGWAMDITKSRLPDSTVIRFAGNDGTSFFAATTSGIDRPDVTNHLNLTKNLVSSGYKANINLKNIPNGEYKLTVLMKFNDVVYICDNGRKIHVM